MSMLARNALAMWFERRLGFVVSGVSNIGMAVAVGTVPALGFALVEAHGWRGAYEVFGIGIWLCPGSAGGVGFSRPTGRHGTGA